MEESCSLPGTTGGRRDGLPATNGAGSVPTGDGSAPVNRGQTVLEPGGERKRGESKDVGEH